MDFEGCIKEDIIGLAEQAWRKTKYYLRERGGDEGRGRQQEGGAMRGVQAEAGGGREAGQPSRSCPLVFQSSLHTQPS